MAIKEVDMSRKRCVKCRKYKDLENYRVRAASPDGRTSRCALCLQAAAAYQREHGKSELTPKLKFHEPHETLGSVCNHLLGKSL